MDNETQVQVDTAKALVKPEAPSTAVVDVDYLAIIDAYPQLREMPPRDAQIVMLFAAGMQQNAIADFLSLHRNTVQNVLAKYDIGRVIRKSVELQKLLLANSIGSIMVNAISQIRKRQNEFEKMPVAQLINLLKSCVDIQRQLQPPAPPKQEDAADLIERMKKTA